MSQQEVILVGGAEGNYQNQFMGRHRANHIQVAYAPDARGARLALSAKAAMMAELGINVSLCGDCELD